MTGAADGVWEWELVCEDGTPVAETDTAFDTCDQRDASITAIKDYGPDAEVMVVAGPVYETYRRAGQWGWQPVDADRRPLAVVANTHAGLDDTSGGLETFRDLATDAPDVVVESYGVELREDQAGWGWLLRDAAHRQLATSEVPHESKGVTENKVSDLLDRLERSAILEAGQPTYKDSGEGDTWEWRLVDRHGATLGESVAAVESRAEAHAELETVREYGRDAWVSVAE